MAQTRARLDDAGQKYAELIERHVWDTVFQANERAASELMQAKQRFTAVTTRAESEQEKRNKLVQGIKLVYSTKEMVDDPQAEAELDEKLLQPMRREFNITDRQRGDDIEMR